MSSIRIFAAPLQGLTESPFRTAHFDIVGSVDHYFTPFVRIEKGSPRPRDLRDTIPVNHPIDSITTPQIIFRDFDEFTILVDALNSNGHSRIDLNMGCPFPPQVKKGRGAATLLNSNLLQSIATFTHTHPHISFSAKIRLGVNSIAASQFMPLINDMKLSHLTIHPRIASQQYSGQPDLEAFNFIARLSSHPIVYNGDITSLEDAHRILDTIIPPYALMLGRGLISRPTLPNEIRTLSTASDSKLRSTIARIMLRLLNHYSTTLSGEGHIILKIAPFWPYLEYTLGHKVTKSLRKARNATEIRKILSLY